MRLYYFTGPQFALENIKKRRLKISFADEVNDAFELKPFDFGKGEPGRRLRIAWQKAIQTHAKTQGFISFSKIWSSPPMWAHYAGNHRGVCYGFDIAPKNPGILLEIQYVKELRLFRNPKLNNSAIHEEELDYAKKTKSALWSYEQEYRAYCSLSDEEAYAKSQGQRFFFSLFNDHFCLREVIIGANSSISSDDIRSLLREEDQVTIRTSRASFRKYEIVEQMRKSMQK